MKTLNQWLRTCRQLRNTRAGSHLSRALVAAWLAWLLAGCATTQYESKELRPISSYQLAQEADGLKIAVEPLTDAAEAQRLFRINLPGKGILAVFVIATNSNSASSFLLMAEQFTLVNRAEQSAQQHIKDPASISTAMTATVMLGIFGSALIGQSADQALANDQNFHHRELGRHTVSPGRSASGYIYFQIPKTKVPSTEWLIRYTVKPLGSDQEKELTLPFTWLNR